MKRSDIITLVSQKTGMKKKDTATFVDAYEEVIKDAVVNGEPVILTGFLKIEKKEIASRKRFIPATQQMCEMKPHNAVKVTVSRSFKEKIK